MTEPTPPAAKPTALTRSYTVEAMLACVGLLFFAHLARLFQRHTFWYDEAMLLVNITEASWRELFGPLPFYDQAAPVLYLLAVKAVYGVFGLSEIALRLPSWIAAVAAVWLIAVRMPGLNRLERTIAAAVLAGGVTFAYLTTETKQYSLEVLGSCALMVAFYRPTHSVHDALRRLSLLLVAMLATSTFPLTAFAVGTAFLLADVRRPTDLMPQSVAHPLARLVAGGWVFIVAGIAYVAYYLAHIKVAYAALLGNFGYTYQGFGFVRDGNYLVWLANNCDTILASHYGFLGLPLLAAALFGGWTARARDLPYGRQVAALVAVILVLNVAGVYPLLPARFSVFLLPWFALFAGLGLGVVLAEIKDHGHQLIIGALTSIVVLLPAISYVFNPVKHQARQSTTTLLAHLRLDKTTPIMVTVSGQPVYDLYVKARTPPGGDRCIAHGVLGYTNRCRALKAPGDGVMQGSATKWYLLNYAAIIGRGVPPVGFPGTSPQAFAASYITWLVEQLPKDRDTLLFTAPHTAEDTDGDPFQARLKAMTTVQRLVDERTATSPSRAGQLDMIGPVDKIGQVDKIRQVR
jgi:hypothetical protein